MSSARTPSVREFRADEWRLYRELRLRALADSPDAFGSTYEDELQSADSEWEERLSRGVASEGDRPLVAEVEGAGVGLAWGRRHDTDDEVAHLFQMWVAPEARRLGVGQRLLGDVVAWARERGFRWLRLGVTQGNSPASSLYERAGFRPVGTPEPLRQGSELLSRTLELELHRASGA